MCFADIKARLAPRIRGNVFRKMETPNNLLGASCLVRSVQFEVGGDCRLQAESGRERVQ